MTIKYAGIDRRIIAVLIIASIVLYTNAFGVTAWLQQGGYHPSTSTVVTTTAFSQQQQISGCNSPNAAQPQAVSVLATHYAQDSAITNGVWYRYLPSTTGGTLTLSAYSPGAWTDGTTIAAAGSFSIGPPSTGNIAQGPTWEFIGQSTGYNAYPMWVNPGATALGNTQFINGYDTFTVICQPSASNSAANNWAMSAQLVEAPTTATTVNTYIATYLNYGQTAPTAMPTASQTWNFQLIANNTADTYKDALLPFAECGTNTAPVTNYAVGSNSPGGGFTNCPSGPGQGGLPTVQGYMILMMNQTAVSVGLGNGAPAGMTLTKINSGLATGTTAWLVAVPAGPPCPGTGVSAGNACILATVPISLYETQSAQLSNGKNHIEIVAWFVDFQQGAYLSQYLVTPATTTTATWAGSVAGGGVSGTSNLGTAASYGGTPSGVSGLTPTASNNAGNPAPQVSKYNSVILTF